MPCSASEEMMGLASTAQRASTAWARALSAEVTCKVRDELGGEVGRRDRYARSFEEEVSL